MIRLHPDTLEPEENAKLYEGIDLVKTADGKAGMLAIGQDDDNPATRGGYTLTKGVYRTVIKAKKREPVILYTAWCKSAAHICITPESALAELEEMKQTGELAPYDFSDDAKTILDDIEERNLVEECDYVFRQLSNGCKAVELCMATPSGLAYFDDPESQQNQEQGLTNVDTAFDPYTPSKNNEMRQGVICHISPEFSCMGNGDKFDRFMREIGASYIEYGVQTHDGTKLKPNEIILVF